MKILFYGGCHAQALVRIFEKYAVDTSTEFKAIINFSLIAEGKPFPYSEVTDFDAIVFSPIIRNNEYNTTHLVEFCSNKKIPCISFPWLEWRGYFPGTVKGKHFLGVDEWHYAALLASANQFRNVEEFIDSVYANSNSVESLKKINLDNFNATTKVLSERESELSINVPVSEFIIKNFRNRRLFLTPDHPTIELYKYVSTEIAKLLNIKLERSLAYTNWEPQAGLRIPILPFVYEEFDLEFRDSDFEQAETLGMGTSISLTTYLKCVYYFAHGFRSLKAKERTVLKSDRVPSAELLDYQKFAVQAGTILLGKAAPQSNGHIMLEDLYFIDEQLNKSRSVFLPAYAYEGAWTNLA